MQTIYLDISNKGVIPTIYAKQGDVGRKFEIVFTDSGLPYTPPNGSAFSVWYSGTSGEGNYTDIGDRSAFSINANKVSVEMIAQMLENFGDGVLCLVLNESNGNQIGSWNIPYMCEQVPGIDSEEAKSYYTAFSEAVANLPYPDNTLSVAGKAADAAATGEALAGKAPAGYGLGGEAEQKDWSEVDSITANGTYRFGGIHQTINGIYVTSATMLVINFGGAYCTQILRTVENASGHYKSYTLVRSKGAIGWDGWECPDPPLVVGVEYRTTERWKDKAVYTKLVHIGTLPTAGNVTTCKHGAAATNILRCTASTSEGATIPTWYTDEYYGEIGADKNSVFVTAGPSSDYNTITCDAQIWYTKD